MPRRRRPTQPVAYRIYLPIPSLVVITVCASLVAYFLGQAARSHLDPVVIEKGNTLLFSNLQQSTWFGGHGHLSHKSHTDEEEETCLATYPEGQWSLVENNDETSEEDDDSEHPSDEENVEAEEDPTANHLLLDFQGVNPEILQSEEQFKNAMVRLVEQLEAFRLQYIYSNRTSNGNLLVGGISKDNDHVWLCGWPKDRVVLLDVFFSGEAEDFLGFVPQIEDFFGDETKATPGSNKVHWAHKSRGFEDEQEESDVHAVTDLLWFPVGTMLDHKVQVCIDVLFSGSICGKDDRLCVSYP